MVRGLSICKKKKYSTRAASSEDVEGDENQERGNWTRQMDFILSCIGYAVGLGNIWRFPYLCMRNGGGAFIIPYFLFLLLCGIPLFFMELSLGQFSSLSPVSIWKICPLFKGVGWGMIVVSGIVCIYYNIIITWVLYYLFASFTSTLPWSSCGNYWNTPACVDTVGGKVRPSGNATLDNSTSANVTVAAIYKYLAATSQPVLANMTNVTANITIKKRTASEEFFHYNMLELSPGVDHMDGIKWQLMLCLALSWVIVFLCLCKGVKSSGKVVYVTATLPYVFLTFLLIRGLLLEGAVDGVLFYIVPDFQKLLSIKVWQEAALQIFYSLGPAWGGLITMASYNRFHNNVYRDSLLVPVVNCGTSFYGGFVIFSVIGHMAKVANVEVKDIVTQGPGLAFIVYPEALSRLPISPLWAIMFFLMLLTIGLDSQFGMLETLTSSFVDEFPKYLKKRKMLFLGVVCVIEFFLGLPLVSRAGMYLFQILDWYAAAFSVMFIALFECLVISWVYGSSRLYDEIEMMIGYRPCIWWAICWRFITPALMVSMLIYSMISYVPPTYGDYQYPFWAQIFGWCVATISLVPIPTHFVRELLTQKGNLKQRFQRALVPDPTWGPALQKHQAEYRLKHNLDQGPIYKLSDMKDSNMSPIHEEKHPCLNGTASDFA